MKVGIWLRRLLPILAIVGIIVGPFIAPANGTALAGASPMSMSGMTGHIGMTDDMRCCPHGTPEVPDCPQACPMIAACVAKCFSVLPTLSTFAFVFLDQTDPVRPGSDAAGEALSVAPPARPPRT